MRIITFVTHSEGTFEQLVKNKYGVKIEVLGFGKPWKGFMDKLINIRNYLDTVSDDEIVIILDGFDTKINKDPADVESIFRKMDCKVLLSREIPNFVSKIMFGVCKNNETANAGMYMGYCKYLKILLDQVKKHTCKDDQRNMNTECNKLDFIKVDENEVIFKNMHILTGIKDTNAYFIGFPGTLSIKRMSRFITEYSQFFITHITFIMCIIGYFYPKSLPYLLILLFIILMKMDDSCL